MTGELSPLHWVIVIGVFMLLFGAKRMPDAARSLGRSIRILKAELGPDQPGPHASTAAGALPPTYTAPTVVAPPADPSTPPTPTA